jgi:aspartyl protease family protein
MSGRGPEIIYYAMVIVLVLTSLTARKLPLGKTLKMALAWVAIFAGFFLIFAFRSDFLAFGQRIKAEAIGSPIEAGNEIRVPISEDGHYWVEAKINGRPSRFLIDSGASVTTVSRQLAQSAGVDDSGQHAVVDTANGPAPVVLAYADRLEVQSITRTNFPIDINDRDETNVLGMNFLSSLDQWRVEGNYLVLRQ